MDSDLAESVTALKAIFEQRKLSATFGAAPAPLIETLKKTLRLPSRVRAFYAEANPTRVEAPCAVERIRLFPAEELLEEQKGYALLDDGTPKTEVKDGTWKKSWIIVGRSTMLGDPYFLDVAKLDAEGDCPVYTTMTGTDRLEPRLAASTFAQFLRIVSLAMEVAQGFGEAVMDDDDEATFRQALGHKIKPLDPAALRAGHWT